MTSFKVINIKLLKSFILTSKSAVKSFVKIEKFLKILIKRKFCNVKLFGENLKQFFCNLIKFLRVFVSFMRRFKIF